MSWWQLELVFSLLLQRQPVLFDQQQWLHKTQHTCHCQVNLHLFFPVQFQSAFHFHSVSILNHNHVFLPSTKKKLTSTSLPVQFQSAFHIYLVNHDHVYISSTKKKLTGDNFAMKPAMQLESIFHHTLDSRTPSGSPTNSPGYFD